MQTLGITRHESAWRERYPKGKLWGRRNLQGWCLELIVMGWGYSKAAAMKIPIISDGKAPETRSSKKHKKEPKRGTSIFLCYLRKAAIQHKTMRARRCCSVSHCLPSLASPFRTEALRWMREEEESHVGQYWTDSTEPFWPGCPKRPTKPKTKPKLGTWKGLEFSGKWSCELKCTGYFST